MRFDEVALRGDGSEGPAVGAAAGSRPGTDALPARFREHKVDQGT